MPYVEHAHHHHDPIERGHLFLCENGSSMEEEYRALTVALMEALKVTSILEIGTGAATAIWARFASRTGASLRVVEPADSFADQVEQLIPRESVFRGELKEVIGRLSPVEFVILDSELQRRAEELDLLFESGVCGPQTTVVLHDTSRRRTISKDVPDPASALFWDGFRRVAESRQLQWLELPFSRGMIILHQPRS